MVAMMRIGTGFPFFIASGMDETGGRYKTFARCWGWLLVWAGAGGLAWSGLEGHSRRYSSRYRLQLFICMSMYLDVFTVPVEYVSLWTGKRTFDCSSLQANGLLSIKRSFWGGGGGEQVHILLLVD